MDINYIYTRNTNIQNSIIRIETAKRIIEFLPQLPHIEESLRRKSLLKSSVFSAQIEGNTVTYEEILHGRSENSENKEKIEIFNILRTFRWIYAEYEHKQITIDLILKLHKIVMQNIYFNSGRLRKEPSAIFNQAGVAIYIPPPPSEIKKLLEQAISNLNESKDHAVINSAIFHFVFEKIHPFMDGNGRVGRILSSLILKNSGYDFRGLVVFEEYLVDHREEYYDTLSISKKDITEFVEFFLQAIAVSSEKIIELLQNQKEEKPEDLLLPRRREILMIIREHEHVSFDFIKRRFFKIPDSSLHYDLQVLQKMGFIKKLGTTRGALYSYR